jgi:drug/metabolite transporter (DMT)-like permease
MKSRTESVSTRHLGVVLAVVTALISGFAVFINGYGLRAWAGTADPTAYTTFKNIVAALVLIGIALVAGNRKNSRGLERPRSGKQWAGLGLVAVLGGALAFALFFEGFARASSTQAAFIHKTLIIWVGILAVGMLREKVRPVHIGAVALLVAGQFLLVGGVSEISFGIGEAMMLAATLLWSIEIIIAKRLLVDLPSLTVGVARMAGGAIVLIVYGMIGGGFAAIGAVSMAQIGWVLATGVVLSGFVGFWYAALARAPAIDVTAILVGGAVITAALKLGVSGVPIPSTVGLVMVFAGAIIVAVSAYPTGADQTARVLVDR